jgi:hypothetical protein
MSSFQSRSVWSLFALVASFTPSLARAYDDAKDFDCGSIAWCGEMSAFAAHERSSLLELLFVASPLLLALYFFLKPAPTLPLKVSQVLVTATCSVLALGFTMMRFTTPVPPLPCPCFSGFEEAWWLPSLIVAPDSCVRCVPAGSPWTFVRMLNVSIAGLSVLTTVACLIMSLVVMRRFAQWTRERYKIK